MSAGGLVCGFWDEASGLAGLGWTLGGSSGGLLLGEDQVAPAAAQIEDQGETALLLEARGSQVRAELRPRPSPSPLAGANGAGSLAGEGESAPCVASVTGGGAKRTLECPGHLTRWAADPTDGAGVLRHLALQAPEGGLLVVLTRGDAGAESHGAESSSALLLDPEGGASSYSEAFLSTQYDPGGRQSRAGLELWGAEDGAPPMRAAGTRLGDAPEAAGGVTAALLRTSAEGTPGLGSYLIWRG